MKLNRPRKILTTIFILVVFTGLGFTVGYFSQRNIYAKMPGTYRTSPIISGTFIQYTSLSAWNYNMWDTEFARLQTLGFDTIILQWVHDSATNKTLYQSQQFAFESDAVSEEMHLPLNLTGGIAQDPDVLRVFFHLGLQYNITIHVGVTSNWNFHILLENHTWVENEIALNHRLADEILTLYANWSNFGGLYIPYEMYQGSVPNIGDAKKIGAFCGKISNALHQELTLHNVSKKPVSIAPYAGCPELISVGKLFWKEFLAAAKVDVLMIQDGIGGNRMNMKTELQITFRIVSEACDQAGVIFWADLEIFDLQFQPAPFSRVQTQLEVEAHYVEKIIIFDIPHYLSTQYSDAAQNLLTDYEEYLAEID